MCQYGTRRSRTTVERRGVPEGDCGFATLRTICPRSARCYFRGFPGMVTGGSTPQRSSGTGTKQELSLRNLEKLLPEGGTTEKSGPLYSDSMFCGRPTREDHLVTCTSIQREFYLDWPPTLRRDA